MKRLFVPLPYKPHVGPFCQFNFSNPIKQSNEIANLVNEENSYCNFLCPSSSFGCRLLRLQLHLRAETALLTKKKTKPVKAAKRRLCTFVHTVETFDYRNEERLWLEPVAKKASFPLELRIDCALTVFAVFEGLDGLAQSIQKRPLPM